MYLPRVLGHVSAGRFYLHQHSYCIEGHLCVPCVQKTQQSPLFGRISSSHFSQLYLIMQTSVGMVSIFLCPHFGQVISHCITTFSSEQIASLVQQESFDSILSVVVSSSFVGTEQFTRTSVPMKIEKYLIGCIRCCFKEMKFSVAVR